MRSEFRDRGVDAGWLGHRSCRTNLAIAAALFLSGCGPNPSAGDQSSAPVHRGDSAPQFHSPAVGSTIFPADMQGAWRREGGPTMSNLSGSVCPGEEVITLGPDSVSCGPNRCKLSNLQRPYGVGYNLDADCALAGGQTVRKNFRFVVGNGRIDFGQGYYAKANSDSAPKASADEAVTNVFPATMAGIVWERADYQDVSSGVSGNICGKNLLLNVSSGHMACASTLCDVVAVSGNGSRYTATLKCNAFRDPQSAQVTSTDRDNLIFDGVKYIPSQKVTDDLINGHH